MIKNKLRNVQRKLLDHVVKHHAAPSLEDRAEGMVQLFEKQLPRQSKILDIGGGWGFYKKPLGQRGHFLTVIDVVKPALQRCPVVIYKGKTLPFPDKSFDVSLLITVLHHIHDIEQVMKEAIRVTRRSVIVVEDIYHQALGRFWTILRDQLYNFEFIGHPKNFKTQKEWLSFFGKFHLSLKHYEEVSTTLAGMKILNGIFVLDCHEEKAQSSKREDEHE